MVWTKGYGLRLIGTKIMLNSPLVSVIIPTYNRADIVKRAISSALNQTYQNLEIIVIDNASSDNTVEAVGEFSDRRVKFIQHPINKGPAASRNTGIRNVSGEYVAFLDSDDEWASNKILRQLEVFKKDTSTIGLVFTNGYDQSRNGRFITDGIDSGIFFDPAKDKYYPLRRLITTMSSWMLPAAVVRRVGYFEESMHTWDDGDYLVRVSYEYPLYFLNEDLVTWHATGTHLNVMSVGLVNDKEVFLERNLQHLLLDKEYLFKFYRALGKDALKVKDRKRARKYLLKALSIKPFDLSTISKIIKA